MGEPNTEIPSVPVSVEDMLRSTSERYKLLRTEAGLALDRRDLKVYHQKLIEAGQLVARLDPELDKPGVDTSRLSENDRSAIAYFSTSAKEYLDKENFFGLSAVFDNMGSKIGEPNNLEKLIERVYPAPKPVVNPQQ